MYKINSGDIDFIKKRAKSIYRKHSSTLKNLPIDIVAYESLATIGFMKSVENYNQKDYSKVRNYASKYISGEIKKEIDGYINKNRNEHCVDNFVGLKVVKRLKHSDDINLTMNDIMYTFDDKITDEEKKILLLMFCDNKSLYKISKSIKKPISYVNMKYKLALNKIKTEITSIGDVANMNDIKKKLCFLYGYKKIVDNKF